MSDGTIVDLGRKITGTITAANQRIRAEFMELPRLSPGVLLGMDILSRLNLQIFLNGIEIAQKGNQDPRHACAIEGPVTMENLGKKVKAQAEKFLDRHTRTLAPWIPLWPGREGEALLGYR